MDRYDDVAAAIIEQAARDYYTLVQNVKRRRTNHTIKKLIECIDFFRSSWYEKLTELCDYKLTGIELMKILNKNISENIPMGKKQYA